MDIAIDTETRLFKPTYMAPKVICLSWATSDNSSNLIHHKFLEDKLIMLFQEILDGTIENLIGHNIAYDLSCIYDSYPSNEIRNQIWELYDTKKVQCTVCREKLLDIAEGQLKDNIRAYSLANLVKKYFDIELDKDTWRLRYSELEDISLSEWPQGAKDYAIDDAITTLKLYDIQTKRLEKLDYDNFLEEASRQASYDFALRVTSCRGLFLDMQRVHSLKKEIDTEMEKHYQISKKAGLWHVKNGKEQKNTARLKELIIENYPGEPPRTKPSKTHENGQVKTDSKTIKACIDNPSLSAYSEYKKLEKINSTYLKVFIEAEKHIVHSSYNSIVHTGRTSSFGPNIQNQPRKKGVRECFIARPNWVFIFCDYDSHEIRTLAEVCYLMGLDSTIGEQYRKNPDFDPHVYFAAKLMDIEFSEALQLKKEKDKTLLERRQQSKAANFGFPGGMGAETFIEYAKGYDVKLSFDESQELKNDWFNSWPEMYDYFNIISNIVGHSTGTVQQFVSGRLRGGCVFTSAANTYFQGLAADVSKYALYQTCKKCFDLEYKTALAGCRPVIFMHDEIGIEAPESYAQEAAKELETTMIQAMEELCTHVPARATSVITRRWSKKAENIYDANGNWIPWDLGVES